MLLFRVLLFSCVIVISLNVSQAVLNFEDEYFHGKEADRIDWSKHPCNRPCVNGAAPRTCHYRFVVESYMSMSKACYNCPRNTTDCYRPHCLPTDGNYKLLFVVDRTLPGPYIQVCRGDRIVVDVKNMLEVGSTTIHWHGITQVRSPYMDGVPYVTQCPILPENTFRYQFEANKAGTYWWHSHSGGQRAEGLFGGLTIRVPPIWNPHRYLYDFDEHSMIVNDWKPQSADEFLLKMAHVNGNTLAINNLVTTMLINGVGRYKNFAKSSEKPMYIPSAVFTVKKGFRYRFRMLNAGTESCPIQMSVDNHTLTVISTDGNDVVPRKVDSIFIWSGERYDFIINADKKVDNYWIRYRAHGILCNKQNYLAGRVHQVAILRYESAPLKDPEGPVGWDFMPLSGQFGDLNHVNVSAKSAIPLLSLKTMTDNDAATDDEVKQQLYISYDYHDIDNYDFHRAKLYGIKQFLATDPDKAMGTVQLNHITFKMPPIPVLSQRKMLTPDMLCNSSTLIGKDCENQFCACTHVLQVKLNTVVELVIVDEGKFADINHPMHLHGNSFRVVAAEQFEGPVTVDQVKKLDREGKIKRTLNRAPIKDTVRVPNRGFTILRLYTDNPGYWFFHCHFDEHSSIGMALVLKIGQDDDMLPVPKNFPQCGSYVPQIM